MRIRSLNKISTIEDEANGHQAKKPHQPVAHLAHVRAEFGKAFLHTSFQPVKTSVQVVETMVDVNKVRLPHLFGMGKSLFHALFEAEKAFVHPQDILVEVFLANKLISHVAIPLLRVSDRKCCTKTGWRVKPAGRPETT